MKKFLSMLAVLVVASLVGVGCDSSSSPTVEFLNQSDFNVTVKFPEAPDGMQSYKLDPNGGSVNALKSWAGNYDYSPRSKVKDTKNGDLVVFENR